MPVIIFFFLFYWTENLGHFFFFLQEPYFFSALVQLQNSGSETLELSLLMFLFSGWTSGRRRLMKS